MELWDLYDRDLNKTGETLVRGEKMPDGRYHMVVHVLIFNSKGQMLIQQRQSFKDGWPGMWDLSVGGSAVAGDSSHTAAEREAKEELGLDLTLDRPKVTIHFSVGFDDIYTVTRDLDPATLTLQESEVQAARWADEEEIHQMIDDGRFIPFHHSLISLLFTLRDRRGTTAMSDPTKRKPT